MKINRACCQTLLCLCFWIFHSQSAIGLSPSSQHLPPSANLSQNTQFFHHLFFMANETFGSNLFSDVYLDDANVAYLIQYLGEISPAPAFTVHLDHRIPLKPCVSYIQLDPLIERSFPRNLIGPLTTFLDDFIKTPLNDLFSKPNFLPSLNTIDRFRIQISRKTNQIETRFALAHCDYNNLGQLFTFVFHPIAFTHPLLFQYTLRHIGDHAWFQYQTEDAPTTRDEERRVEYNSSYWLRLLDPHDQAELTALLNEERRLVFSDKFQKHVKAALQSTETPPFQGKTVSKVADNQFVMRTIDEANPIKLVFRYTSNHYEIRIIKIKEEDERYVIVFHIVNMNQPDDEAEFKIRVDTTLNIGRAKENQGIVRVIDSTNTHPFLKQIGSTNDINDIVIDSINVSRRHLCVVVKGIQEKQTQLCFIDRGSRQGTQLLRWQPPPTSPSTVDAEDQFLPEEQFQAQWENHDTTVREVIKRINWEIDFSNPNWKQQVTKRFQSEVLSALAPHDPSLLERFRQTYPKDYPKTWIHALDTFQNDILYLRSHRVNLVFRLKPTDSLEEVRANLSSVLRKLQRIPSGLMEKFNDPASPIPYMSYVYSQDVPDGNAEGYVRQGNAGGTIAIQNKFFEHSMTFSGNLFDSVTDLNRDLSGDRTVAHELIHYLHLIARQLSITDFINILRMTRSHYVSIDDINSNRTIRQSTDVADILNNALSDAEGNEHEVWNAGTVKMVARQYRLPSHTTIFYGPAETVAWPGTRDPQAVTQMGQDKVDEVVRILQGGLFRSRKPVGTALIEGTTQPVFLIYDLIDDQWTTQFGDGEGNVFIDSRGAPLFQKEQALFDGPA